MQEHKGDLIVDPLMMLRIKDRYQSERAVVRVELVGNEKPSFESSDQYQTSGYMLSGESEKPFGKGYSQIDY